MKSVKVLLLACVVGVVLCDEPEWSTCSIGAEEPMFKPKIVDLTPLVGERGGDLTFKIDGVNNGEVIAEGTFEVDVDAYYCFFGHCISKEVYTETKSICDRTACPIQVGKVKFEYLKHLPAYTPPGNYRIKLIARESETDGLLMCMTVEFSVSVSSDKKLAKLARKVVVS